MKTTKKDFEIFKEECEKWIEKFGLKDWEVKYSHKFLDNKRAAEIVYNIAGRLATITFPASIDKADKTEDYIRSAAFEEICHLLLAPTYNMMDKRYGLTEEEVNMEEHRIIRILENVLRK
ncbi:MAG: hypothetical protein SWO11_21525 [Thermodesulfobacteriota bacterium]|nr:hypothetical protein [Thermodesulfobacteriota bacterium]